MRKAVRNTTNRANDNQWRATQAIKKVHDVKIRPHTYEKGNWVWRLHVPTAKENKKFAPRWDGPYEVHGVHQNENFTIKGKHRTVRVHHILLRPYRELTSEWEIYIVEVTPPSRYAKETKTTSSPEPLRKTPRTPRKSAGTRPEKKPGLRETPPRHLPGPQTPRRVTQ